MFYNEIIGQGLSFLKSCQNNDGGIPIGRKGDSSGYWTSAEVLEAVLSTDFFQLTADNVRFVIKLVQFLLCGFISTDSGGYWEGAKGSGASTMTTGHIIFSLSLFRNTFLDTDLELSIDNTTISLSSLREKISITVNQAVNWLLSVQNNDNGWGPSIDGSSNSVCCYYVVKGLTSVGLFSGNDNHVHATCILNKKNIQSVLKMRRSDLNGESFACLLYSYMCLKLSHFFREYDKKLEADINTFIKKHWKQLQRNSHSAELASASKTFLNNLPWITLNALLQAENYKHLKKIDKSLQRFVDTQNDDGSWFAFKNGERQTTWITAEILNDFNLAHTRYLKYQNEIVFVKKHKAVVRTNILLAVICLISVAGFVWDSFVSNLPWFDYAWNYIITVMGLISAIITMISLNLDE